MKSLKDLKYFIYGVILAIGILIGIAIRHYNEIPLSDEINLVDLATLVATVFLAVYIPEVLDRKLQNTRDKKVLLEERVAEFQALLKSVNTLVQDDSEMTPKDYLTIRNTLDVSGNKLATIATLIPHAKLGGRFEEDVRLLISLSEEHASLLVLEEYGKGPMSYSEAVQAKEEELYNKIDQASILLIFKISDS